VPLPLARERDLTVPGSLFRVRVWTRSSSSPILGIIPALTLEACSWFCFATPSSS